ncbi:MAG: hypothetical protein IT249_11570 [Chitinophagaceae bacterium]|nr:hypothetical protein [Chitinophagaceae bacterium]
MRLTTENFEIVSGGNIYTIKATEYINGSEELRYRVSFNDNPICVFGWNDELNRFAVMHDKRNPNMSNDIEVAISKKLEKFQQLKEAA